jgi:hypothetical protein
MDSINELDQELDDILLDDLVEAQERMGETTDNGASLTPAQAAPTEHRSSIVDEEIKRLSDELDIPESTQNTAKTLFDRYSEKEGIQDNALEVLAAACLYTACKVDSMYLSPDDFANAPQTGFTRVILLRRVKTISGALNLNPQAFLDPTQYIDHYCEKLGLDQKAADRAHGIISAAEGTSTGSGKSPTGRAASAIYNAVLDLGLGVTQVEIADVADVTEVTIRNTYQDQREQLYPVSESGESEPVVDENIHVDSWTSEASTTENRSTSLNRLEQSSDNGEDGDSQELEQSTSERQSVSSDTSGSEDANDKDAETLEQPTTVERPGDFAHFVGEDIGKKIQTALNQLDETNGGIYEECVRVCRRIDESSLHPQLNDKDATVTLGVIRYASMEAGAGVHCAELKEVLQNDESGIQYSLTLRAEL